MAAFEKTVEIKIRSISRLLIIAIGLFAFSFLSNAKSAATPLAIQLQINKISNGIARLDWTFQSGIFELIRTDPSGNSDTIYRGTDLFYTDTISAPPVSHCKDVNFSYRVEIQGLGGSASNTVSGVFRDDNRPPDVVMDSISIDPNGHPVISWKASTTADVAGYEIQREFAGGIWDSIGFSPGKFSTSFTSLSSAACADIMTFAILTVDQCGIKSPGVATKINPLNTLLIGQEPDVNECLGTVTFSWNPYINMKPALAEYQIFRKEGVSAYTLIGSTAAGDTKYTDTYAFIPGFSYYYYVRAVSQGGQKSSRSCEKGIIYNGQANPDEVLLNYVSVFNNQFVKMGIHFGPVATVSSLRVYRADTPGGVYTLIDSIFPGILADIPYTDASASVNSQSYYYQIRALNSCKLETLLSGLSRTIFLTCKANTDQSNTLTWNEYEGWANIDHYEINRLVNGVPDPANPVATTLTGTTAYRDLPAISQQAGDIISYYITAIEGNVASPDSSVSNIAQALRQPLVEMPNAFHPQGTLNNIFRPVMDFVDDSKYQLLIYNKWGQQIFVSTNKNTGWDGKFKGEYAPVGIYFYRLQYSSFTGDTFTKTGSVMLVE